MSKLSGVTRFAGRSGYACVLNAAQQLVQTASLLRGCDSQAVCPSYGESNPRARSIEVHPNRATYASSATTMELLAICKS